MEGAPLSTGGDDAEDHRVEIAKDFADGNTEGSETDLGKACVADCIALGTVVTSMMLAIPSATRLRRAVPLPTSGEDF